VTAAAPASDRRPGRARLRLDGFEAACAAVLLALALTPLTWLLVRARLHGGVVAGADGYLVADPLQYVNWLRQMGEHGAAANLYDLRPGPHSFVHPGLLLSGLAHRAGLGPVPAYLAWKPVAVATLFLGALLYVRRFLARRDDRRLALVVALFAVSPVAAAVAWTGWGGPEAKFNLDVLANEMWAGHWLSGYLFTVVAVGLMPLALLAYERGREAAAGRRWLLAAAAAGLACAWLQPWQGAVLALAIAGAEAVGVLGGRRRLRGAAATAAPVVAAIALPLAYYYLLSRLDPSWALAGEVNRFARWPWWITILGLAPLGAPALLALRVEPEDFGGVALRLWPAAALAVFYLPLGTFPFHALQGLGLPLAILAVAGARTALGARRLAPAAAVAAAAVLVLPGLAYRGNEMRLAMQSGRQPHLLTPSEHDALRHLDRAPQRGGVLAPAYIGVVVPAYTGRETWVGAGSWTPDAERRQREADDLFAGRLSAPAAERLVRSTGARFLLSDCRARADISGLVAGVTAPPRRFGCATVYRVRGGRGGL
jgi:hypothetical protein